MENDFKIIVHQFTKEIIIYPISDVHLGSLEHNEAEWKKFIAKIQEEPNAHVILLGDLMNNATRSSVSNIFDEVYAPSKQKKLLIEYLKPIKNRILCAVSGNHERRSLKDADDDPTYDIMCKLDLEHLYRRNIAFLKIQIGTEKELKGKNSASYMMAVTHGTGGGIYTGAAVNRNERFAYTIDGLDCLIVGHSHKGTITKPAKLVFDPRNNVVTQKPFTVITSQSWLSYGGYAVQKMLLPSSTAIHDSGIKIILEKRPKNLRTSW